MRAWVAACACLALSTGAGAQMAVAPQRYLPLGPFAFGMSTEQARAAAPVAAWDVIDDTDLQRGTMRSQAPVVELQGVPFKARLSYAANAVTFIQLTASTPLSAGDCAERQRALVGTEVRVRGAFARSEYWHRFYQDPDAPTGRMEGDTYVPAPSVAVRGDSVIRSQPGELESVIRTFRAPQYGQEFHEAIGSSLHITAHSITRGGQSECRLTMTSNYPRGDGGFRPSNGPSGGERLAERLASAAFIRPVTMLVTPSPQTVANFYPPRALEQSVHGDVKLSCLILADGLLDCAIAEETPLDLEFGEAGLRAAGRYRVDVFPDAVGKRTELTIRFRLAG